MIPSTRENELELERLEARNRRDSSDSLFTGMIVGGVIGFIIGVLVTALAHFAL